MVKDLFSNRNLLIIFIIVVAAIIIFTAGTSTDEEGLAQSGVDFAALLGFVGDPGTPSLEDLAGICQTDDDCKSPNKPTCSASGLCEKGCQDDAQCNKFFDIGKSICDPDGSCQVCKNDDGNDVSITPDTGCPATAPVCSSEHQSFRQKRSTGKESLCVECNSEGFIASDTLDKSPTNSHCINNPLSDGDICHFYRCVECVLNGDCGDGFQYICNQNRCERNPAVV